jgi:2-methylcitrate dehydratase PrpD
MNELRPTALAGALAEKICGFDTARIDAQAEAMACAAIADTVGVTLAGATEDCVRILAATPGVAAAPGRSLIFGSVKRTSALDAALINATAAHALDFDDVSGVFGGHPSVPLVAPLFALAEERELSGADVVTAYVVGVETETRLARAVHMHHYDKGWHPTATLGVFGAAAATAHLLRLSAAETTTALGIAASFASGLKANFGTMSKPLQVGQSARNGLMAALLAAGGYDANPHAIEHDQGFLSVFNGRGHFHPERMLADWGTPLEVAATISFKQFACCGSAQAAIVVALDLRAIHHIAPSEIARVDVRVPARGLRHTNRPDPRTSLDAKFSVQYAVARALADGTVKIGDFQGDAVLDPAVRRILDVTYAQAHPGMNEHGPGHWGAEVAVTLKNGRRYSRIIDEPAGPRHALSAAARQEKFLMCAEGVLAADQAKRLYGQLLDLRAVTTIRALTALLAK